MTQLILRPFREADIPDLIEWSGDEQFLLQWGGPRLKYPFDLTQGMSIVKESDRDDSHFRAYTAWLDGTSRVGHAEIGNIDYENRSGRFMRLLVGDTEKRGQGLGEALVRSLLDIAFDDLELHRVELGVFDFNVGARKCYEKAGFHLEGTLRECRRQGDEYWNLCIMGMLSQERN